jgi:phosphatidate cytidylyltransferase
LSNAWLRIITALIGIPLVLAAVYLGGGWFVALVVAAALLAQWEVYTMLEAGGAFPVKAVGIALGALVAVRSVFAPALPLALLGVLGLLAYSPFLKRGDQPLSTLASTLFGVVYPTLLFSFLIDLRKARGPDVGAPEAFRLTLAVFFFIWAADTLAYVAGRARPPPAGMRTHGHSTFPTLPKRANKLPYVPPSRNRPVSTAFRSLTNMSTVTA